MSLTPVTKETAPLAGAGTRPSYRSVVAPSTTLNTIAALGSASRLPLKLKPSPYDFVNNAHKDDIHGLLPLGADTFVSGSKDTTIKLWDVSKKTVTVLESTASRSDYSSWVTSFGKFSNGLWASGSRDGKITIRNDSGEIQKVLNNEFTEADKSEYVCKDRNKSRINCITEAFFSECGLQFYTGTPRLIQLWDFESGEIQKTYKVSNNDWVYCIQPVGPDLMVAYGSYLEYWELKEKDMAIHSIIAPTKRAYAGPTKQTHKPHISHIELVNDTPSLLMAALFDGSVRLIDISTKEVVKSYQEHQGRVWTVVNIAAHLIASGADDHALKFWDLRQDKSVLTIDKQAGRVSALLRLTENTLISASCPDDVYTAANKANLSFWDIRKLPLSPV